MRETPVTMGSVKILAGHCNCMAGMGESCSHVASLLWAIEAGVRLRGSMIVTQKTAYWASPPVVKDVWYAKIHERSFQNKSSRLRAWDTLRSPTPPSTVSQLPTSPTTSPISPTTRSTPPPTPDEFFCLYRNVKIGLQFYLW